MERLGVGALLLRKPANLAWYTNGADNRVDHSAPLGVASLLVTGDAEYVVADNIDADRMRAEEYGGLEVVEHPWHEAPTPTVRRLMGHSPLGTDHSLEGPKTFRGRSPRCATRWTTTPSNATVGTGPTPRRLWRKRRTP